MPGEQEKADEIASQVSLHLVEGEVRDFKVKRGTIKKVEYFEDLLLAEGDRWLPSPGNFSAQGSSNASSACGPASRVGPGSTTGSTASCSEEKRARRSARRRWGARPAAPPRAPRSQARLP